MLVIAATFLMAWAAMLLWPGVGSSAVLRDWLVVRPAARLAAIRRGDVAVAVVILAAIAVMTLCEDGSAVRLLLYALPDAAVWMTSIEVSACIDAVVTVAVALSAWRGGARAMGGRVRFHGMHRATRAPRRTARRAAANDDRDGDRRRAA